MVTSGSTNCPSLISASPRSIHDLSRVELGENELPRFNMPFELGMALGAKRFGGPAHRADRIKIRRPTLTGCGLRPCRICRQ